MRYISVALSIVAILQDGEGEKQKSYLAKCRLPCPVTDAMLEQLAAMKDVVLKQTTPTRVEQRRAMLVMPSSLSSALHSLFWSWAVWLIVRHADLLQHMTVVQFTSCCILYGLLNARL